jgi:O-antigen/teichoic acid export membrane protein
VTESPARELIMARRVVRAAASNMAGRFVSILVWFLLTPFVLHAVGPVAYGLWVLVTSLVSYGFLLDLGVSATLTKYVAEHVSRGEFESTQRYVATAVRLQTLLGGLVFLLALLLGVLLPAVLTVDADLRRELPTLVILMGATVGLSLASSPQTAVLRGIQRFDLANVLVVTNTLLTAAGIVVALRAGAGLIGIVAVTIPATVLTSALGIALVARTAPSIRITWRGGSRWHGRRILRFSSPIFAVQIAGVLQTRTDEFVIAALLSVGSVTPYALARRLSEIPQIVGEQALKVLLPISSELEASHEPERVKAAFVTGTRIALALVAPMGLVIVCLADEILAAWVGPAYANPGPVVAILVAAVILDAVLWPGAYVLQGIGRHQPLALIAVASGILNVTMSIVLVGPLGLAGAAMGTLIGHGLGVGLTTPYVVRVLGVTPRELVGRIALPAIVPLGPATAAIVGARTLLPDPGPVGIGVIAALGLGTYAGVYLLIGASVVERRIARELLAHFRAGVQRPW